MLFGALGWIKNEKWDEQVAPEGTDCSHEEASAAPHRRSGLGFASDTCCLGGGRSLDLDQRATAGTRARGDRGQRAGAAGHLHSDRKSDQVDAEKLARYARLDPNILRPIPTARF
jgi:hypothetical protein